MKKPFEYYVFIQSGSAFEEKNKAGISHFLEHLVFDHSLFKNKDGIDDFLTKNNIYDSAEVTKYFTSASFYPLTKKQLEESRKRIKNLIFNPDFSQEGFERQKRIILEEIAYYKDLPFDILDDAFCKAFFKDTNLEHQILGNKNSLNSISLDDLKSWHEKYYKESTFVEIIFNKESGDLEVIVPDNFKKPPVLKIQGDSISETINKNLNSSGVAVGWYMNNLDKKERVILDVVRNIVGASPQSFVYKRLTEELNLIYESTLYLDHFNGLSVLSPQFFSTQPKKVLDEIDIYKKSVIKNGIDKKAFKLAKQVEEHFYSLPEEGLPYAIGKELMKTGELIMPKEKLSLLKTISQSDIESFMKTLFNNPESRIIIT